MMSLHMGDRTRIDSDHRESQAKKDWATYKDRIYKDDSNFLLPDSSKVLMLATVAENKAQYKLAYLLIRNYKIRYHDSSTCTEHLVLEAKLLYQHLNKTDIAIALLEKGIGRFGIYDARELQNLLDLIEKDN